MAEPMTPLEVRQQLEAALAALPSPEGVEQVQQWLPQWQEWRRSPPELDLRLQVEWDRCCRLLGMDVAQWRTARSAEKLHQRCNQMRVHLGQLLHLL
jgi:hypothetical protein